MSWFGLIRLIDLLCDIFVHLFTSAEVASSSFRPRISILLFSRILSPTADEAMLNNSAVLVHCLAGVSRSVTVTLAYLMHARSINFEQAFALVRTRKPDISPNFHFLRQLHAFECQLFTGGNQARTPLSAQSTDSNYMTPMCETPAHSESCGCDLFTSTSSLAHHHQHHNFNQQLINHHLQQQGKTEYLGTGIGVSPDSGIEFDRWTPADGTPK